MASKYEKEVWELLSFEEIKSTKEITEQLMKKTKKVIAWACVYRILRDYQEDGKVELLKSKGGLFWRKK